MIINMNGAKAPETPSPVLQEKTVTPETLPTVVGADEGYDGLSQVTINPDSQLKAENIRSGKTIFGVDGTFVGETTYSDSIDIANFTLQSAQARPVVVLTLGEYMPNSTNFSLVAVESSTSDVPTNGQPTAEDYQYQHVFKYNNNNNETYSISAFYGLGNVSTYVPSGYYWYKHTIDLPEGDYTASFRTIAGKDFWNGTCELTNVKTWWGYSIGSSYGPYFHYQMYDNNYNDFHVENQVVTVTNGLGLVHLPSITYTGYLGNFSNFTHACAGLVLCGQFKITEV